MPRLLFLTLGVLSVFFGHVAGNPSYGSKETSIPGIDTNTVKKFHCPQTAHAHLSQDHLQAAMDDFAYLFYTKKDVKAAFNKYVANNYVQHNPDIADGKDAAVKARTPLFSSKGNTFEIARVMVGPEYTTIHIKAVTVGQPSYNVFDVYKTRGSCIVEHWDCLQEVANKTVSPHPYF